MITITSADLPKNVNPSYLAPSLNVKIEAVDFDPADSDHRKAYAQFKKSGKWSMRFTTKWPLSVEQTAANRLAEYACKNEWN